MSYPADPAALFIELYDQLPEELFLSPDPVQWERDAWVERHAMRVYDHILTYGVADPPQVEKIVAKGDSGIFTVLRGIDWALAIINPWSPSFNYGSLAELATRYARTGQFNDPMTTEGALLPRGAYPSRPRGTNSKALHFGVHRVTPQTWIKVRHEILPHRHEPSRFRPGRRLPVGCAPLLETFDDIRLEFLERDGNHRFRLAPVDSLSLRRRVSRVIRKLDDTGAEIGVIPEGTLTDDLLKYWKEEVVRTAAREKQLRWLLVGTGPLGEDDPPPNRAVLMDRLTGSEILSQDKLAAFILTADQASAWNLPGKPASDPAAEDITRGSAVTILETSLGRLAILICEDLNQYVQWQRDLAECGISHVFVPSFSRPITHYRWEQAGAVREIDSTGAWLVIANSLVTQSVMGATMQNGEQGYTCLIAGPGDPDRRNYTYNLQFGSAKAGDDLGLVKLNGIDRLPAVHAAIVDDRWAVNLQVRRDDASPRSTSASSGSDRGSPATGDLGHGDPETRNPAVSNGGAPYAGSREPPPFEVRENGDGGADRTGGGSVGGGLDQSIVTRVLRAEFPTRVRTGVPLVLLATISEHRGPGAWSPLRAVAAGSNVNIICSATGFDLRSDMKVTVVVPVSGDSDPAPFELVATDPGLQTITLRAFAGSSYLGALSIEVTVDSTGRIEHAAQHAAELSRREWQQGEVTLEIEYDNYRKLYTYRWRDGMFAPDPTFCNDEQLQRTPLEVVDGIAKELNTLARGMKGYSAGSAQEWLKNQGIGLWQSFFPKRLQAQFRQSWDKITRLSIISKNDVIPWELLYASDEQGELGYLAQHFPIARLPEGGVPPGLRLASADFVRPPKDSPAAAANEVEAISEILINRGVEVRSVATDLDSLRALLAGGRFSLLHFASHNSFSRMPPFNKITLGKGAFDPSFLNQYKPRTAFRASSPLVFINACGSDRRTPIYTRLGGWADAFMDAGAGAFIGSLWEVRDSSSLKFATGLYTALTEDKTISESIAAAREKLRLDDPSDPTWLAYTLWGDPAAKVQFGGET